MIDQNVNRYERSSDGKSQAEWIIEIFGGAHQLAELLNTVDPENKIYYSTIYRWTYSKEKGGTGGTIPVSRWPSILKAARYAGVFISAEDMVNGLK